MDKVKIVFQPVGRTYGCSIQWWSCLITVESHEHTMLHLVNGKAWRYNSHLGLEFSTTVCGQAGRVTHPNPLVAVPIDKIVSDSSIL